MKHCYSLSILALCASSAVLASQQPEFTQVAQVLDQYKEYLENGTYECQDWSSFRQKPLSRYDTLKKAFELFEENDGEIVVELGTTRSFVHGGLPGCNTSNMRHWTPKEPANWDWGAGCFTRMAASSLAHLEPEIHTIDIAQEHILRCKVMTRDFMDLLNYHVTSSVDFLRTCNFENGIDLLYLDTGDITPIEPTALLQLEEAQVIVERDLIAPKGIILIDDVRNQTPKKFGEPSDLGKAKYSIPYLLKNGFEIIADEYQVILQKKEKPDDL